MQDNVTDKPRTPLYLFADFVLRTFFRLFYRIKVEGAVHIPSHGGIIIASNHMSNFDPPIIGLYVSRYIRFMGKDELFHIPILGRIFNSLGGFPIKRGTIDRQAIRTAVQVVQAGGCLVMFPEGHRSKNGELGPFMPGIASIAKKAQGMIVPTAIVGPYRLFHPLHIRFGEPIATESLPASDLIAVLRERIESLLK